MGISNNTSNDEYAALRYAARRMCNLRLSSFNPSVSVISEDADDNRVLWTETFVSCVSGFWHLVRVLGPDGTRLDWGARFHPPLPTSSEEKKFRCTLQGCTNPTFRPHHHHMHRGHLEMQTCSCDSIGSPGTKPKRD